MHEKKKKLCTWQSLNAFFHHKVAFHILQFAFEWQQIFFVNFWRNEFHHAFFCIFCNNRQAILVCLFDVFNGEWGIAGDVKIDVKAVALEETG